jgi:hypothetical protein
MDENPLAVLIEQLTAPWEMLDARLTGRKPWSDDPPDPGAYLTDDEFFWEPVPDCWSLRRRGEATSPTPTGKGDWVLDGAERLPKPAPFTTIAWRMCHLCVSPLFRYDYTFGSHSLTLDGIEWPATASAAVEFLRQAHMKWYEALQTVSPEDALKVGLSQNPMGLDPNVRFIDLVAWTNIEFAHHAAEIACVRDLYASRSRVESA